VKLEEANILTHEFKSSIFANVSELLPIHEEFLHELECQNDEPEPDYSDAFSMLVAKLGNYSAYCSSQSSSLQAIEQMCNEKPQLKPLLEVCSVFS
jgi:hypothetical protein